MGALPMKARQSLPANYRLLRHLDLSSDRKLLLWLNLAGLALFFAFLAAFSRLAAALRPPGEAKLWEASWLASVIGALLVFAGVLLLHEAIHGLFFWLVTGGPPRFGLRAAYAYAAAPGWYIPRNAYLVIGLAPLVWISLLGAACLPYLNGGWLPAVIFGLAVNASGAIGDVYVVAWASRQPAQVLVNDHGDAIWFYAPEEA
jgi:hypothetical protein